MDLQAGSDSGVSDSDNLTNDATPLITVTPTDDGSGIVADGTIYLDVDLNDDGDYADAGELGYTTQKLSGGTVTFPLAPALAEGIYRYLPLEHKLVCEFTEEHLDTKIVRAVFGQGYPKEAAVTFIWTAIPYRMEWRYGIAAHKVIAIDAGHVCQNLYLACEAIDAGTCAMAAYDQEEMDKLLRIDGQDEFTVYLASVGKKHG